MEKQAERKLYSLAEIYTILYKGISTSRYGARGIKEGLVTPDFKERIMLAVTEVNNCPMCSYFHAKVALESGMNREEIEGMLAGTMADVPTAELPAVLFAQHYAEYRGKPSKEAWGQLVKEYGYDKARAILGLIRTIMMGNAYGIPLGSLKGRPKGMADPRSSLLYELEVVATLVPFILAALIHALFATLKTTKEKKLLLNL